MSCAISWPSRTCLNGSDGCGHQRSGYWLIAPLARFESGQAKVANLPADQSQGGEADSRGHSPHLAIAAFGNAERYPARRNTLAEPDRRFSLPEFGWIDALHFGR